MTVYRRQNIAKRKYFVVVLLWPVKYDNDIDNWYKGTQN